MPARATVPPFRTARSATGTISPAGAKTMAPSTGTGSGSSVSPAHAAPRDLEHHVSRGAEAVEGEPTPGGHLAPAQRAVADDPGAEERRRVGIGEHRGNGVRERLGHHRQLRIAAVGVVARVAGRGAEVLGARPTGRAGAVGVTEPGDPHAVTGAEAAAAGTGLLHRPDHLMPRHHRQLPRRQVPLDHVEVGPADPAHPHADQQVLRTGDRRRPVARLQGPGVDRRLAVQHHRPHAGIMPRLVTWSRPGGAAGIRFANGIEDG
jgi:hypothetical protein